MQILRAYAHLFLRYRWRYAVGLLALTLTNVIYLAIPRVLGWAIDELRAGTTVEQLVRYALALGLLAAAQALARAVSRVQVLGASRRVEYDLKGLLYDKLLQLAPSFYQALTTGDLMSRMTNDATLIRALAGPGVLYFINAVMVYVLAFGFMMTLNPTLTVVVFLPLPLIAWLVRGLVQQVKEYTRASREALGELNTTVQENLAGVQVVKSFALEESQIRRFEQRSHAYMNWSLKEAWTRAQMVPIVGLVGGLSYAGVLGFGGRMVTADSLSLGDLVAFLSYVTMMVVPTVAFGWILSLLQRGAAALERLDEVLKAPVTIASPVPAKSLHEPRGRVRLRGLTFRYGDALVAYERFTRQRGSSGNGRRPALIDVSLHAEPGEVVALVGRVGSGKSTLLKALLRLIEVPPGTVFVDDVDVCELDLEQLRRSIAYVPQDDFLFSASLFDNIAYGCPDAGFDAVRQAARTVGLAAEIEAFPRGYQTPVGERGLSLSGGQRQRVALARALLINCPVLALDNALSHVDTGTEREILAGLARSRGRLTVIASSNRISAIQDADRIHVLENGLVADVGSHAELIQRPGLYAAMYEQQQLSARLKRY